jgi:hypothetical protein
MGTWRAWGTVRCANGSTSDTAGRGTTKEAAINDARQNGDLSCTMMGSRFREWKEDPESEHDPPPPPPDPRRVVSDAYWFCLGRAPESEEVVRYWTDHLARFGAEQMRVMMANAAQPEMKQRIIQLYHSVLGRAPESDQVVEQWLVHWRANGFGTFLAIFQSCAAAEQISRRRGQSTS